MRILFLIVDGFGGRNFVLNGFPSLLPETYHIKFVHDQSAELESSYQEYLRDVKAQTSWARFHKKSASRLKENLRLVVNYIHMRRSPTVAHKLMFRVYPHKPTPKHTFAKKLSYLLNSAPALNLLEAVTKSIEFWDQEQVQYYEHMLEEFQPDIVISSSHWRPEMYLPVLLATRKQIPTLAFIPSWDNITSKGRITVGFDFYLVWSQLMMRELQQLYPSIKEDCIKIVGTPQFDNYVWEQQRWNRAEFCDRLGLDAARPIILYAGGAPMTNPDEPEYLRILMEKVRQGEIEGNPQVVFRPAPIDNLSRYHTIQEQYPELVVSDPIWDRTTYGPYPQDPVLLHNLLYHSAVIINITSTITLDAAIFDKPVINPAFDVSNPLPHGIPLWDFHFQFEHYRYVVDTGAARISHSVEEFVRHTNAALADPFSDTANRRAFVTSQIGTTLGTGAANAVEVVQSIVMEHALAVSSIPTSAAD